MKVVILAEKPSQAKAYAEAFEVAKKEKTHIELKPCSTFKEGAIITWGIGHLVSLKMPGDYKDEWKLWN
ncbi:MAG: topoisomerase, partial [Erysipelotrichaceae bacterium]